MSRKSVQVRTDQLGVVDVDVVLCDNHACNVVSQEKNCVNWYHVDTLGIYARMMGDPIGEEADFCSLDCLRECITPIT